MEKYLKMNVQPSDLNDFTGLDRILESHSIEEFTSLTGINAKDCYVIPTDPYDDIDFIPNLKINEVSSRSPHKGCIETLFTVQGSFDTVMVISKSPLDYVKTIITRDRVLASIMDAYLLKTNIIVPIDGVGDPVYTKSFIESSSLKDITDDLNNRYWDTVK